MNWLSKQWKRWKLHHKWWDVSFYYPVNNSLYERRANFYKMKLVVTGVITRSGRIKLYHDEWFYKEYDSSTFRKATKEEAEVFQVAYQQYIQELAELELLS
jgi:hypothetical protein